MSTRATVSPFANATTPVGVAGLSLLALGLLGIELLLILPH
jgi:hypothetical protein